VEESEAARPASNGDLGVRGDPRSARSYSLDFSGPLGI